jgi:hypothetical protein
VEVRAGGRIVFRSREDLEADRTTELDVLPRPNVALWRSTEWPAWLGDAAAKFGDPQIVDSPREGDATSAAFWREASLPGDTDIVLARLGAPQGSSSERWVLYSPILGTVESIGDPPPSDRPLWVRGRIGAALADSRVGGPARVVALVPGGPAERAGVRVGDRVITPDVVPVPGSREERSVAEVPLPRESAALRVESPGGTPRTVPAVPTPVAAPPALPDRPGARAFAAAWASVDAASSPADEAAAAAASLAWLLGRAGRHTEAAAAWRVLAEGGAPTVCVGAASHEWGVEAEAAGLRDEAAEAFRRAFASECASFVVPAVMVAPAAAPATAR